ncbi:MAG: hypothetical protein QXV37_01565, partial [Candidatus Jordarchaeaceae archaeon]
TGIFLFYTFQGYAATSVVITLGMIAALFSIVFLIMGLIFLIFGLETPFLELWATIYSATVTMITVSFVGGLDYSLKISSYNLYFTILMVVSGILIAAGFFSKFSEERRSSYILSGVFGLVGITAGGIAIYLALNPISNYVFVFLLYLGLQPIASAFIVPFTILLTFSVNANSLYLSIGSLLLFLGFLIFGITHIRTRSESAKPKLCAGIGVLEIITGIVLLGGTIGGISILAGTSATILTVGFALMLITFILWIPTPGQRNNTINPFSFFTLLYSGLSKCQQKQGGNYVFLRPKKFIVGEPLFAIKNLKNNTHLTVLYA